MDNSQRDPLQEARLAKVRALREAGRNPYRNGFAPTERMGEIRRRLDGEDPKALEARSGERLRVAGRILAIRSFGKACFLQVRDATGELQLFVRQQDASAEAFASLSDLDVGDFVGAEGPPMRTRTGELSILVRELVLLTKAVRPLPEKWHGLSDVAIRYRQRYVDLVANPDVATVMRARSAVLRALRENLDGRGFFEVETPVMATQAGGAAARPFATHHHALDLDLYLRVAPELWLKRLLVGGLDRVYELGRVFRNEGISTRHNPEFTMLEAYQAYATYEDFLVLVEELVCAADAAVRLQGSPRPESLVLDRPFARRSLVEAVRERTGLGAKLDDAEALRAWHLARAKPEERAALEPMAWGERVFHVFEAEVEPTLEPGVPVFFVDYPADVSPLARRKESDPRLVDRFELYVGRNEHANAFSELNDPEDQAERFKRQAEARARGDEEAMPFDADYVRALEYGMPPAAGLGIGVDRLVMTLTGQKSIRDVIAFPLLRPEEG